VAVNGDGRGHRWIRSCQ